MPTADTGPRAMRLLGLALVVAVAGSMAMACSGSLSATPAASSPPAYRSVAPSTSGGTATAPSPAVTPTTLAPAATPRTAGSIVTVDPFAGCEYSGPGTLHRGRTYEPSAAVGGPPDRRIIAALYYQDFIEREGMNAGLGFVAAVSADGGQTWTDHAVPFGACAGGGKNDAVSNGRVAVGPDGTIYVAAAAGDGRTPIRLVLTASADGGLDWTRVTTEKMKGEGLCHADEPSVTADPLKDGHAYAVWVDACWPRDSYIGISATEDGGKTWTPSRDLRLGGYAWTNWPTIVGDAATGALHLFFSVCRNGSSTSYKLVTATSTDGGASWDAPIVIAEGPGQYGPDPSAALAPDGPLYVAWDTSGGLLVSASSDRGRTWSPTHFVADTHSRASLAVSSDGAIAIAFVPNEIIESTNQTVTFSKPRQFSDLPLPPQFAGDYTVAAVAYGTEFHAIFECMLDGYAKTCFW